MVALTINSRFFFFIVYLHISKSFPCRGQYNFENKNHEELNTMPEPVCHSHGVSDPFLISAKQQITSAYEQHKNVAF